MTCGEFGAGKRRSFWGVFDELVGTLERRDLEMFEGLMGFSGSFSGSLIRGISVRDISIFRTLVFLLW